MVTSGEVSEEHDKRTTIKLEPENEDKLEKLKEKYTVAVSLTALANAAIKLGLPELEKKP